MLLIGKPDHRGHSSRFAIASIRVKKFAFCVGAMIAARHVRHTDFCKLETCESWQISEVFARVHRVIDEGIRDRIALCRVDSVHKGVTHVWSDLERLGP